MEFDGKQPRKGLFKNNKFTEEIKEVDERSEETGSDDDEVVPIT